jgi:translation initiation factor 3 subunit C
MSNQQKGRFWGGDSDNESVTSESDESSFEGGEKDKAPVVSTSKKESKWAVESESESEDENRVAKSAKDRSFDVLQVIIKAISNQLKINNWVGLQEGKWV